MEGALWRCLSLSLCSSRSPRQDDISSDSSKMICAVIANKNLRWISRCTLRGKHGWAKQHVLFNQRRPCGYCRPLLLPSTLSKKRLLDMEVELRT